MSEQDSLIIRITQKSFVDFVVWLFANSYEPEFMDRAALGKAFVAFVAYLESKY